ncbi:head decoration protein [Hydrogenovibrio sp. 3SP14C1]|uniref:head decoration protein n=1 Tax=Hydrogenovibrio sp. 3SP14C1 TaxID=3038774 RepID=UPI0024176638|nr:head decoration protein [Hydrogenovibrio sp. 3SP14C1]MDG4811926.1 head decoration protein [Hydrogenovibrio sp. 3SP14C1]
MLTEKNHPGEFILSEGNGHISREIITIEAGQVDVLYPGQVLGKVTATGKYSVYDVNATDGTETAAAVLYDKVDATGADMDAVAIVRLAELKELVLTDTTQAVKDDFASLNLFVR